MDSPLRTSLWNLLYRVVSANDRSGTAWISILRGACLVFFKETIDDLPAADNEASMRELKRLFFALPGHRVYDLFEFLLADDRSGIKELDRKLFRRGLNPVLEEEGAPVRLLRDRFVPLADEVSLDALTGAEESLSLFDLAAARRHMESALGFLARRPEPAGGEAVREAVIAVAAVVHRLHGGAARGGAPGTGAGEGADAAVSAPIVLASVEPVRERLGIPAGLAGGIEAILARCLALSGLPGAPAHPESPDPSEATFLVVFCASVIRLLVDRGAPAAESGGG